MASKEPKNRKLARKGSFRKELQDQQKIQHHAPLKVGTHSFTPSGDGTLFSPDGMDKDELEQFVRDLTPQDMDRMAKSLHGSDAKVVGGSGKVYSAEEIAKGLHSRAKKVVGTSGRELSIEDMTKIIRRQQLEEKRQHPHLIDRILDGDLYNPEMAPPMALLHQAKKFVFDAGASEYVGSLVVRAQEQVLEQHEWARPPFEVTWIELDHQAYWERGLRNPTNYEGGPPDNRIGFLINGTTVWCFSYAPGHPGKSSGVSPFQFKLHVPISHEEELEMAKLFNFNLVNYRQGLLGGMLDAKTGEPVSGIEWWRTTAGEIVRSHMMFINPAIMANIMKVSPQQRAHVLGSGAGDLKILLMLLLMITKPRRMFNIVETGPKRMLYKGHNLVRRAHSVVTMRLEKEAAIKRAVHHEFTSSHRQMHDVRGHWAQNRGAKFEGCEHEWEPVDKNHFYCTNCKAKRWWKKAHSRGHLDLGDKTTDYTIKR